MSASEIPGARHVPKPRIALRSIPSTLTVLLPEMLRQHPSHRGSVAMEEIETVVIGGGQAGLSMSYYLGQWKCEHIVLERGRIGERWRSQRWDSLTFQFPNWMMALPGYAYRGSAPDAFAPRDEVAAFVAGFASHFGAPVRCGTDVSDLRADADGRFRLRTNHGEIRAANVVVATGPYQKPAIPRQATALSGVLQVHSGEYLNPRQLPAGAILLVGAGASGCQIAEDLLKDDRRIFLAVGGHRRVPRRYRGKDFAFWEFATGEFDRPVERRPTERMSPLLTGADGGHDVDLRAMAREGAVLLGRLAGADGDRLAFADDAGRSLARGDAWYEEFLRSADACAERDGLDLPNAEGRSPALADPKEVSMPIRTLDLRRTGVSCVIWSTGFRYDFDWIRLPVLDQGRPLHRLGVSPVRGLYFLGLPWLSKRKSSLLAGVGEDAARLAAHIAERGD
jgi:putative flavoprotein involved in K+ transport